MSPTKEETGEKICTLRCSILTSPYSEVLFYFSASIRLNPDVHPLDSQTDPSWSHTYCDVLTIIT